jgi:rare lipoprotein A
MRFIPVQLFAVAILLVTVQAPVRAANQASSRTSAKAQFAPDSFDGHAHWYGGQFHGRKTASGKIFDKHKLTAAHPSLPFGTKVLVKSQHTGKQVVVEITDRCPQLKQRCIDLSEGAARAIGIYPTAPSMVHCQVVSNKSSH